MRKIGIFVAFLAVCAVLSMPFGSAKSDVADVDNLIKGVMITQINSAITVLNGIVDASNNLDGSALANDSVGADAIGTIAQSDTNATTTATSYTPAFIGQVLVGGAGAGTNGVWIAKGLTTNDWVVVAP